MDYKIEKFSAPYLNSLTKLLDQSFSIQNKNKSQLVKWKYFDEFFRNQTITYIAFNQSNEVISHYANLPISISYQNEIYKAMVCTDMCTDPRYRGRGLISKLSAEVYKQVKKKSYDLSIGFSNDEGVKVDKNYKEYGYVVVGKFVRYFKVIVSRKKINYKLVRTDTIKNTFSYINSKYFRIKKDVEFLNWRYIKKPRSEYDVYNILEDNQAVGYVILRFINKRCYIYDIVCGLEDKSNMVNILRSIENKALDHDSRIIIYNVLDNKYWIELFNRYKYFKKTRNKVDYHLTVKIHQNFPNEDLVLNKENWLMMNGDMI